MPKPSFEDKRRLEAKENRLQEMRMTSKMKRDVTIAVSSQGFYRTGIMCDVVQVSAYKCFDVCPAELDSATCKLCTVYSTMNSLSAELQQLPQLKCCQKFNSPLGSLLNNSE